MSDIIKKDEKKIKLYKEYSTHPIVESALIRLIKSNRFFASLIHCMDRKIYSGEGCPIPTAAVSVTDRINLYVNLEFFKNPVKNIGEAIYVTDTGDMSKMKNEHAEYVIKVKAKAKELNQELTPEMLKELEEVDWDEKLDKMRKQIEISKFTNDEKILLQNPTKKFIDEVQEAILLHECLHVICFHMSRAENVDKGIKDGKSFNMQALNIAMDCAINQMSGLQHKMRLFGGITLDALKDMVGTQAVEANREWEYYFNVMKENSDKLKEKYGENLESMSGNFDDHGAWEEGEGQSTEYTKEVVKGAVKKAKESAQNAGNMSGDVALLLDKLFTSKVNWKSLLRKFMTKSIKFTLKPTRSRRNRRRGVLDNVLIKPGFKKEYHGKIVVCVDTSGSMSDDDLKRAFTEIKKINDVTNHEIVVIEADSTITQIYPFDPKKEISIKGRGGTAYSEPIKKAVEIGATAILYIGDFDAFDTPEDPKLPFMWIGCGCPVGHKPPADFGSVIYVDTQTGTQG